MKFPNLISNNIKSSQIVEPYLSSLVLSNFKGDKMNETSVENIIICGQADKKLNLKS